MARFKLCIYIGTLLVVFRVALFKRSPETPSKLISFEKFNRYAAIMKYMDFLAKAYPTLAKVNVTGKSYEQRDIKSISITDGAGTKPIILIDAGIHAREWIAPAVALYLMQQLVEFADDNESMIEDIQWIIVPLLNPDGYEYSHTTDRMWRKNRSPTRGTSCFGVDLNRNFNYKWMLSGASQSPCSEVYAGSKPLSELESKAIGGIFNSSTSIKLYITFHSYGTLLLHPWGYDTSVPTNVDKLKAAATAAAKNMEKFSGTKYVIGGSGATLAVAAGGSDDYAMAVSKIDLTYTWELPGDGFVISESKILGIVKETYQGLRGFAKYIRQNY